MKLLVPTVLAGLAAAGPLSQRQSTQPRIVKISYEGEACPDGSASRVSYDAGNAATIIFDRSRATFDFSDPSNQNRDIFCTVTAELDYPYTGGACSKLPTTLQFRGYGALDQGNAYIQLDPLYTLRGSGEFTGWNKTQTRVQLVPGASDIDIHRIDPPLASRVHITQPDDNGRRIYIIAPYRIRIVTNSGNQKAQGQLVIDSFDLDLQAASSDSC